MKPKIIIITGPTASGKTKLSIDIAKQFNGEIISADSIQIYKEANIGSAKVTHEEMQNIPHHLINICNPADSFSAGQFVELARKLIIEITKKGKLPIIVGGTGLYISSLLYPLSTTAKRNEQLRKELEQLREREGQIALYNKLKEIDSITAMKIHPNQTDRIIRAIEIYYETGIKKSQLIKSQQSDYDYLLLIISGEREDIYKKINERVDKMINNGLIEEVENLVKKYHLTNENQLMQGIGYKETLMYLNNEISKEELAELIKQRTRNYAKRQLTWFKKMPNANFITLNNISEITNKVEDFLGSEKNE